MTKMRPKPGFSLLESLIASILLGAILFSLAAAFFGGLALIDSGREVSIATASATEEMERIRDMSYSAILALGPTFNSPGLALLGNAVGAVTIDNPLGAADIRRVTVRVSWNAKNGRNMTRSLVTLVTRRGINRQ
jgi:Tfp pilus assembly protein PilV